MKAAPPPLQATLGWGSRQEDRGHPQGLWTTLRELLSARCPQQEFQQRTNAAAGGGDSRGRLPGNPGLGPGNAGGQGGQEGQEALGLRGCWGPPGRWHQGSRAHMAPTTVSIDIAFPAYRV